MILIFGPRNDRYVPYPHPHHHHHHHHARLRPFERRGVAVIVDVAERRDGRVATGDRSSRSTAASTAGDGVVGVAVARRARTVADVASRHASPPPQRRCRSGGSVAAPSPSLRRARAAENAAVISSLSLSQSPAPTRCPNTKDRAGRHASKRPSPQTRQKPGNT